MKIVVSIFSVLLALGLSPMLPGIINRTKAFFAGRHGPPVLQMYYELNKLFRKGAVYSQTTSWVFRAGPVISLASVLVAVLIIPVGGVSGLLVFPGDLILLAYLLGLMRFVTVLAALDTGSAFEGMGASREVQFSAFAEPAMLLALAVLAACTRQLCLSEIYSNLYTTAPTPIGAAGVLIAAALLIVLLAENARIPVDDPNTHLELTMIHEVMVLDHCGIDLAFIEYGSSLKLWVFGALLVGIAVPLRSGYLLLDLLIGLIGMFAVAVLVGVIESVMARLRLLRVTQILIVASVLAVMAFFWILR